MNKLIDFWMYYQYFLKTKYLKILKDIKGLDYLGRIENKDNTECKGYEGCYPIKRILKKLDIKDTDAVLDIGCGKGLFLYYASKFKFSKIVGIDYSDELIKIAQDNLNLISDERIKVLLCDARTFSDFDKYNYFFLNNPFSKNIMEYIAKQIKLSYKLNPRKICVIYQFPFNKQIFIDHGFGVVYDKFPNSILILS
ncbi:class I SAM-dependent methyltransferase [Clostridium sp. MSJ-8]|uniref:SAM-dependent methyltransferase n=1 Tax=Clostridium sp. MSJ-8 TaxID=2841510 RepID=UPI001C0E991A|nr:class I SAM-dependent methyltransferase [Clostridium sp. MSJ-8]MBU5486743.1 class I SAM-dependent methyltransferase [Clostridium sp. MSJ-8]